MLNNFAATQAGGTGTVTTTTILDSTSINEDVDDDAAIDLSKLSHGTDQKLGIGIFPTETLHVRDTRTSADSAALLIQKPGVVSGAGTHSYGMYVKSAGAGTNNVAAFFRAASATNNYGLIVSEGDSGFGTTTPVTKATIEGALTLKEQSAADSDTAAYGQLWVKSDTPNTLYFTDDAGTDTKVTTDTTYTAVD